jgi:flagellar assembly protein FliH
MSELAMHGATPWTLPQVSGPTFGRGRAEDIKMLERDAFEQGFNSGREAGLIAVQAEHQRELDALRERVTRLDAVLEALAEPVKGLEDSFHRELATLSGAIARQLVRRELRHQPDQIIAVIRETLGLLPGAARDVRIQLHPEDAALVRERLVEPGARRAWTIVEDPVITRGGCRVTAGNSSIDAQLETRIGAAIAAALGDERTPGIATP